MQIALVIGVLALALILFALELLSVDLVALGALLVLILFRCLTPQQAFSSFGSEMIVLLGSIFIIAGALMRTGVLDSIGLYLYRHGKGRYRSLVGGIMALVACTSALMNNTVVTAAFIPVVLALARKSGMAPSKLLMPVAFASMLGGTCTLIGTSTNVAASAYLRQHGIEPFHLFEFLPIGVPLCLVGAAFFVVAGNRLLPVRGQADLIKDYQVKNYLTEVVLRPGCPFLGKRIEEMDLANLADITILGILRGKNPLLVPESTEVLQADDVLILKGQVEGIQRFRQYPGVESKGDGVIGDRNLVSENVRLVEVMVGPASRFVGRSLKEIDFRRRFSLTALALHRQGEDLVDKVGKIPLEVGDVLLVQGPSSHLDELRQAGNVLVLSDVSHFLIGSRKGAYVLGFFAVGLAAGALGFLDLGPALLAAALLTVLVKAIPYEEIYRFVDWRLLILIGGMTSFGQAMVNTGTDRFLGGLVVQVLGGYGTMAMLAGFYLLTVALTQPLSNAAAALTVLPVAISSAGLIGADPRTFALVVTVAASVSFITPLEPSCVLVYTAGRYRFGDFVRIGGLLTLLAMAVILTVVPLFWPL